MQDSFKLDANFQDPIGIVFVEILRRYNWNRIGMLVDMAQCGINLLPLINDALKNATDVDVADIIDVVGTDDNQIRAGLQQLQKSSRSMRKFSKKFQNS